ncbi:MAG: hypothetical protein ABW199_10530 [Caulobacterales bacterium]
MPKAWTPWIVGGGLVLVLSFLFGLLETALGIQFGFEKILLPLVIGGVAAYALFNLSGNREVTAADPEAQRRALAFEPAGEHQTAIYLIRTGFVGMAAGMNIEIDGKPVAQLKSPRFTRIDVPNGHHVIRASFGGGLAPQSNPAELSIEAKDEDKIQVFELGLGMGALKNSIRITPASIETARSKIVGMKMVKAES